MRVIVCGGRDFADKEWLVRVLDYIHIRTPITFVRQGGQMARHPADAHLPPPKQRRIGADYLAKRWAIARMIDNDQVNADWSKFGAAAGPIRNGMMLRPNDIDRVIAFPRANGEMGDGTLDMLRKARDHGVLTTEVVYRPDLRALRSPEEPVQQASAPSAPERAIPLAKPGPVAPQTPAPPQLTLI